MVDENVSEAKERVLQVAGRLFSESGYRATSVRDIATALNIKQSSLYHHAPEGKEQLFAEVTQRLLKQHQAGMEQAIAEAEPNVASQLRAVAGWLISHPPLDLTRLFRADLPVLPPEVATRLFSTVYESVFGPIKRLLQAAEQRGEVALTDEASPTIFFISMIEAIPEIAVYKGESPESLADKAVKLVLDGLRPH